MDGQVEYVPDLHGTPQKGMQQWQGTPMFQTPPNSRGRGGQQQQWVGTPEQAWHNQQPQAQQHAHLQQYQQQGGQGRGGKRRWASGRGAKTGTSPPGNGPVFPGTPTGRGAGGDVVTQPPPQSLPQTAAPAPGAQASATPSGVSPSGLNHLATPFQPKVKTSPPEQPPATTEEKGEKTAGEFDSTPAEDPGDANWDPMFEMEE
eukprot:NODE_5217_length_716_cov_9.617997_g5194_i0.p2 GENE.NODE_5217_length_716_cov_9.617997_g5194_i0~~NODE_5217_length_716_cov_9.617997_g5194_i0.p2  ORF type:complete len:219 (+),score=55.81 NODE_5217_length_716_cov_9.617997_g5194_i0:49-657(+)